MSGEPICTFIAFCDYVITEAGTGKNSLIGTYPTLATARLPIVLPQMMVHITISNLILQQKDANVVINFKHQASGAVLGSSPLKLPFAGLKGLLSSANSFNLNMPFQNLVFQSAGPYACEVLLDGEMIGSRILEILLRPEGPPPQT